VPQSLPAFRHNAQSGEELILLERLHARCVTELVALHAHVGEVGLGDCLQGILRGTIPSHAAAAL
jgi:hypothetical protein